MTLAWATILWNGNRGNEILPELPHYELRATTACADQKVAPSCLASRSRRSPSASTLHP